MKKPISNAGIHRARERRVAFIIRMVLIVTLLILWELSAAGDVKLSFYISYPSEIFWDFIMFAKSGDMWINVRYTLTEAYLGLFYGTVLGIFFGVIFNQIPILGRIFTPVISGMQSIPQLTLAPLYILWFGLGLASKVFLSTLMVFFNVFFSTYNAIKNIDQHLIETAVLLGASKTQILWHIVIPSSMPWIMSGIRIGSSVCMIGAIIGEYIGSSHGIGWMITYATSYFQICRVMSCIIILLVVGLSVTALLERLERYLLRWRNETKLTIKNV